MFHAKIIQNLRSGGKLFKNLLPLIPQIVLPGIPCSFSWQLLQIPCWKIQLWLHHWAYENKFLHK